MSCSTHYRSSGDGPPGNHLHWLGQQKLTTKSVKPNERNFAHTVCTGNTVQH